MKRILITLAAAMLACAAADAQSIKDILKSTASNVINQVAGAVAPVDLTRGTLTYTGAAVELVGDNALSNVAGKAAAGTVEAKVNAELEKAGIKAGVIAFEFAEDNTFIMKFKGKSIAGTYTLEGNEINLAFGKTFKSVKMAGTVTATTNGCKMVFPAKKFLNFIKAILNVAGKRNDTASTISSILKNYDSMKLGFYLAR
ncbi:MAG: DUF4923 family protein [Bacteroidales bacterium]|nr:DUF4923 family protein [Bacteroidales bacterium]